VAVWLSWYNVVGVSTKFINAGPG